jgi:hypothetical protein
MEDLKKVALEEIEKNKIAYKKGLLIEALMKVGSIEQKLKEAKELVEKIESSEIVCGYSEGRSCSFGLSDDSISYRF